MKRIRISGSYLENFALTVIPFSLAISLLAIAYSSLLYWFMTVVVTAILFEILDASIVYFFKLKELYAESDRLILDGKILLPADIIAIMSTSIGIGWDQKIWIIKAKGLSAPVRVLTKKDFTMGLFEKKLETRSMLLLLGSFPELEEKIIFYQSLLQYQQMRAENRKDTTSGDDRINEIDFLNN